MKSTKLTMIFMTLLIVITTGSSHASQVRLTYSSFFPSAHVQSKLAESWGKEVEARTGGAVKVDFFPGGTLTGGKQCYEGVAEGISDIGFSVAAYSRGRFPVMSVVDLPLGYDSGVVATRLANDVYRKFLPKEFSDTQVMYFHAHGPGLIHTGKKRVEKLSDLKGLKLRATGNSASMVKALGATPVAMSMSDSYQSIRKGVVDGGVYPMETNKGWRMAEVVKFCTQVTESAYSTVFFVTMNKDRWNEIAPEHRNIIEKINTQWAEKHGKAWDESDAEGLKYFLSKDNELIKPDVTEREAWKSAVQPVIDNYSKTVSKRGVNGGEVLDFARKRLAELQTQ